MLNSFLKISSIAILSCVAAGQAKADIIVSGDTVVIKDGRRSDSQPLEYKDSNGRTIKIYNKNSNSGEAFIMRDGRLTSMPDGEYVLPSGQKVKIRNGRMEAKFGDGNAGNKVKILPRN